MSLICVKMNILELFVHGRAAQPIVLVHVLSLGPVPDRCTGGGPYLQLHCCRQPAVVGGSRELHSEPPADTTRGQSKPTELFSVGNIMLERFTYLGP